jgi:hypothetical protein
LAGRLPNIWAIIAGRVLVLEPVLCLMPDDASPAANITT